MPDISTLVDDIYAVVEGKGGWDQAITDYLAETISTVASARFSEEQEQRDTLSLSGLGKPCDLELWRRVNTPELAEPLTAEALGTFFYGDLLEALVISLAKAAGHKVEGEQEVLYVNGIKGHMDCIIDGHVVDVKSASSYGFQKFQSNNLKQDDPFGYVSQLSSYLYASKDDPRVIDKTKASFLVVKKDRFKLCLDTYDFSSELETKEQEVQNKKDLVEGPQPERLEPIPQSKTSPNTKLCTACSYCSFRKACWPEARTFVYSNGPTYLVDVVNEPRVPEVKDIW